MADKSHHHKRKSGGGKKRHGDTPSKADSVDTADQRLIELIVKLGDNTNPNTLANHLVDLVSSLQDSTRNSLVLDTVFRCIVALPCKTSTYAVLLTLMCCENQEMVQNVLDRLKIELTASFLHCDYYALKFLLRFVMELSNCHFITTDAVHSLYEQILQESTSSAIIPQHIPDFYIHVIISALAIGKNHFVPDSILALIEKHISSRQSLSWLSPITNAEKPSLYELQIAELSSYPGKDSLEVLYLHFTQYIKAAVSEGPNAMQVDEVAAEEMGSSGSKWLRVVTQPFRVPLISTKLFGGSDAPKPVLHGGEVEWLSKEQALEYITFKAWVAHENETIRVPLALEPFAWPSSLPSCHFTLPKPLCHIFPAIRTNGEGKHALSQMERWFFEDYALDILHFFRSTHADIPRHMNFARHLSDYFDFGALICEIIFKDFLRIPTSPYPPVHHGVIILDFIQKLPSFSTTVVEATTRIFGSLENMHISARVAIVDWFSYHLSNTEFKWDWADWAKLVQLAEAKEKGESDGSRKIEAGSYQSAFIREVLSALVRLSYYERIAPTVTTAVPDYVQKWLPEKPEPAVASGFYSSDLAQAILEQMQQRNQPAESVLEPIVKCGTAVPLTSEQVVQCVMRAILVEGSTSITLLQATLMKYRNVLEKVAYGSQVNLETPQEGARHLLQACLDHYPRSPQHFMIAVLALLHRHLVSANNVVAFLLRPELLQLHGHHFFWWDLLSHTVRFITQSQSVKELEIINLWKLACKSNPNSEQKSLAKQITDRPDYLEKRNAYSDFERLSQPLLMTLFSGLIDILARPPSPSLKAFAQAYFESIALKYRRIFVLTFPELEILISSLPNDSKELCQNLNRFAQQY
jgi:hypothetical protein